MSLPASPPSAVSLTATPGSKVSLASASPQYTHAVGAISGFSPVPTTGFGGLGIGLTLESMTTASFGGHSRPHSAAACGQLGTLSRIEQLVTELETAQGGKCDIDSLYAVDERRFGRGT